MLTNTDAVLWYNVGKFGDAGYAVPNWSDDPGSLNPQIIDIVDIVGQNLFYMMHHEDADMRVPPSINTLTRVHRLYIRFAQILNSRGVGSGTPNMEPEHIRPAGDIFRVYPVPYFKVRNAYMKRWGGLIMMMLAEAMQHTENRKEMEVSTQFTGQIGQYMTRIYRNMAIELFGKKPADVNVDGFVLTQEDLNGYNPAAYFTSTEMVDTVPRLDFVFTEDVLAFLREGIPVDELPSLGPWPENLTKLYSQIRTDQTISNTGGGSNTGSGTGTGTTGVTMPPVPLP